MYTEVDLNQEDIVSQIAKITECEWDAIALSSFFRPSELAFPRPGPQRISPETLDLLKLCANSLKTGGLLFVYGPPHHLPAYSHALEELGGGRWSLRFRYWLAARLNECDRADSMQPAHVGVILHFKADNRYSRIKLQKLRLPHIYCAACGENVKDWGGKKFMMHPEGPVISDAWTDLPMRALTDHRMPEDVVARLVDLVGPQTRFLHLIEPECAVSDKPEDAIGFRIKTPRRSRDDDGGQASLPLDQVQAADCIEFMDSLLPRHDGKAFDLIFADPPYNLKKMYASYTDEQAREEYLRWCDRWLAMSTRLLKPGGSMYVLNLPDWAISHARILDHLLDFRRWIVWRAPGEPRGTLLPAHYSLLYYTKPGGTPIFNYDEQGADGSVGPPDSLKYCVRIPCVAKRKAAGDVETMPLTDIWYDIHRIRHKRDRDYHPCQLPEKLLERVILLSSNPGQVVFDPFCGTGTTAVVAQRLGRHFVTTDIDPVYVDITRAKLRP